MMLLRLAVKFVAKLLLWKRIAAQREELGRMSVLLTVSSGYKPSGQHVSYANPAELFGCLFENASNL